ncbi:MAG TPA: hypothetical protein VFZ77_18425 [Acidimicrobiales bacterium]
MGDAGTVTVFVDDAVLGRFPQVCAATGRPSDGWLTVRHEIARSGRVSTPILLLLLVIGPVGWAVLLFLALATPDRSEELTVQVPWTGDTQQEVERLRGHRTTAWVLAAAGAVASLVLVADAAGVAAPTMAIRVVQVALLVAIAVAVIAALDARWRLGRLAVAVDLDASRRWVTLSNVHPAFVEAVRRDQAARRQPSA